MVMYKCIECQNDVKSEDVKRRVRCPYCGNKILYKPRTISSVVPAI
jgi:DNA-directed RNA polymerase subunit RPC12/RpoP